MARRKMKTVTAKGGRVDQLKALAAVLADSIDSCEDGRSLPPLARQYRETVREIEELEGVDRDGDAIGAILAARRADGQPDANGEDSP